MTTRLLVILRHAKADRPTGMADLDRPLTQRGHADAGAAGAWLVAREYRPGLVLCSPARRTRQTWHGVAMALGDGGAPEVHYDHALYESGTPAVVELLRRIKPEFGTVLVIGHNPMVSMLSESLDPAGIRDSDGLRTSGLAVHSVPGEWATLAAGNAPLLASHTARA